MSIRRLILAAVLVFLVVQLNLYFAWTSHVGMGSRFHSASLIRPLLVGEVNVVTRVQLAIPGFTSYFTNLAHGSRYLGPSYMLVMKLFIDCEVIAFTLAIFLISLFHFRRRGLGVSLLRAFEITSSAVLPLGVEIYLYDRGQFNIHASDIQVKLHFAWFTNADVLYASLGILGICLLIEVLRHARRREIAAAPPEKSLYNYQRGYAGLARDRNHGCSNFIVRKISETAFFLTNGIRF